MHTATFIAVFARIIEEVKANIWVDFASPFATFASLSALSPFSTFSAARGNISLAWVAICGVHHNWTAPSARLADLSHQMAVLGGKRVFHLVPSGDCVLEFNLSEQFVHRDQTTVVARDTLRCLAVAIFVRMEFKEHMDVSSVDDTEVVRLVGPSNLIDLFRFVIGCS
jgi:hypothetical protein